MSISLEGACAHVWCPSWCAAAQGARSFIVCRQQDLHAQIPQDRVRQRKNPYETIPSLKAQCRDADQRRPTSWLSLKKACMLILKAAV